MHSVCVWKLHSVRGQTCGEYSKQQAVKSEDMLSHINSV